VRRVTVFELYFPVTRKEVSDEKAKIPLENYLGHGEKILVVDDEEKSERNRMRNADQTWIYC